MSVIPTSNALKLYQGSTLDRTLTFYTDAARTTLKDLTGYTAAMMVRKDFDSAALLTLANGALSDPPAEDVLVMGGTAGTVRIYVTDETMADLAHSDFVETTEADGSKSYSGLWDLELTNADGETSRYLMGPVSFSREVTHA